MRLAPFSLASVLAVACAASIAYAAPPRFAAPFLYYATAFDGRAVALADVNADGHSDVLALTQAGLEVRLGAGDGTLGAAILTPLQARALLVAGDLDGDGDADVVTEGDSLHVAIRLGNGDGSFAAPTSYAALKSPSDATLTDLDGDDDLDLVCTASRSNVVSAWKGDGAGAFGPRADVAVGPSPSAIAAGDLDHDGDPDVVVAHTSAPWGLTRLVNDGAGGLGIAGTTALPDLPWDLALADLNGDTWLDAVTNVITTPEFPAFFTVPGGPGGFGAPASHPLSDISRGVVVTDVNGDARPDVVTFGYNSNNHGDVFVGQPGFTFEAARRFGVTRIPVAVVAGDLNGGGKADLVSIGIYGGLAVHMGNGDGTFGGVSDLASGFWSRSIACADLDADGHVDIATTSDYDATAHVRFGDGSGSWTEPITLFTASSPLDVKIADVDVDGHLDLVVAESGPGTQTESSIAVFRGDGARGFGPRQPTTVGRWAQSVAIGDLDGDALPDAAVALNDFDATLTVLHGTGGGWFGPPQNLPFGSNAGDVVIADVTRDGREDILLTAYYSGQVFVIPRLPGGGLGSPTSFALTNPVSIAAGDVAGDPAPDIVVSSPAGLSVYPSTTGGGFASREDHTGGSGSLAVADLDLDGRVDVATANDWNSNTVSTWFGGASGLGPPTAYGAGDQPVDVAAADVNEDGLPDLVCVNAWSGTISFLLNTGGAPWLPWLGVPPTLPGIGLALRFYPNPAHGPAMIRYRLPRAANVRVRLLDVAGRQLVELERGVRPAGERRLEWSTRGLPAGIGFLELTADGERAVQRVVLLP